MSQQKLHFGISDLNFLTTLLNLGIGLEAVCQGTDKRKWDDINMGGI